MTTLARRTVAALRAQHDSLSAVVAALPSSRLNGPSGAEEWTVAQVLSHLGSGAEIALAGLRATLSGNPPGDQGFNQSVWDRWNAMTPQDQAAGFLRYGAELVEAYEGLTSHQLETVKVELGFAPAPLSFAAVMGMRLSESALHHWDVAVALDPAAGIDEDTAHLLAEHYAGEVGFLLGFIGKPGALSEPAVVGLPGTPYSLALTDPVRFVTTASEPTAPEETASFTGPLEAVIRLIGGRLSADHTPPGTTVTGNVSLDDLRRVFPGF